MKKLISLAMVALMLTMASCGDTQRIEGTYCPTYGWMEEKPSQCQDYEYRVVVGNVVWSFFLCEGRVFPLPRRENVLRNRQATSLQVRAFCHFYSGRCPLDVQR